MTHQSAESDSQADSLPGAVRGAQRKCMNLSRENLKLKAFARKPGILRDPHNINLKRVTHQPQNARVTFRLILDLQR